MRATGIVRRIDDLGRIVIPKEIRKILSLNEGDPLETFVDGQHIIFRRYIPGMNLMATLQSIDEQARELLEKSQAEQVHELIKQIAQVLEANP